jgi:hypothetical protein
MTCLAPILSRVEADIEAQLLPEFDLIPDLRRFHYVEFNLDSKLRGSFEEMAAIGSTAVGGPFITVNEFRARLNLPPVDGGDEMFVPLNSIRAGGPQASPQSPTDTPASGVQPVSTTPGGGTAPKSIEEILADHDAAAAKAASDNEQLAFLKEARVEFEDKYAQVFENSFARQRNAVEGGKAFNIERWNKELAADLLDVSFQAASAVGEDTAMRIKGEWSQDRTYNFLKTNAESTAGGVNATTKERLDGEAPDLDAIFGNSRALSLAVTRTTFVVNWAQREAVHQNGEV